jgi:hypothetical protein
MLGYDTVEDVLSIADMSSVYLTRASATSD